MGALVTGWRVGLTVDGTTGAVGTTVVGCDVGLVVVGLEEGAFEVGSPEGTALGGKLGEKVDIEGSAVGMPVEGFGVGN